MKTVVMEKAGRLTVPVEVRRALGLTGETELEIGVNQAQDTIILRPVGLSHDEDAWAFMPEHRKLLDRARQDSQEGRVRRLTEDELARLGE